MSDSTQINTLASAVVGKPYSDALAQQLSEQTGRRVRPAGKGYFGTTDVQSDRINLNVNDEGVITSYCFG